MKQNLTDLQRLDLAARAEAIEPVLLRSRVMFIILALVACLLSLGSSASRSETISVWMLSVTLLITAFMMFRRWAYAPYAVAIVNALVALGALRQSSSHYPFVGSANLFLFALFLQNSYNWWRAGAPMVVAGSDAFRMERSQAAHWLVDLRSTFPPDSVVEFSSKSFWSGYWTYRIINVEGRWAIARFKFGNLRKLVDYRIRAPQELTAGRRPDGSITISIAGQLVPKIEVSAESRDRLLHSVSGTAQTGNSSPQLV